MTYAFTRCNELMSVFNRMFIDSNYHGSGKVSDRDRHQHQELNVCTSEKMNEAAETFKKADKKVGCKRDSCLTETELSLGDQSHFDLSPTVLGVILKQPKIMFVVIL
ncbi:hypothetical protein AB3S75_044009 [Citrus x aurantiifolia]